MKIFGIILMIIGAGYALISFNLPSNALQQTVAALWSIQGWLVALIGAVFTGAATIRNAIEENGRAQSHRTENDPPTKAASAADSLRSKGYDVRQVGSSWVVKEPQGDEVHLPNNAELVMYEASQASK